MKRIIPWLIASFVFSMCSTSTEKADNSEQWVQLFNGKNLDGWIVKINHHELNDNFGETFRVEDGMIKVRYDQYGDFVEQFGHLFYKQPFSKYHLVVEYRFTGEFRKDAPEWARLNSGIMFHSQDPATMPLDQNFPISIEFQLLAGLGDGNPRPTGNMCSPGTEIVFNGEMYDGHCLNSTSPTFKKDDWVRVELIVLGDSLITHIVNGATVLQYSHPTMGGGVVSNIDSAYWQPGKQLTSGFIAMQSEGQPVEFRKIEIMNLEKSNK